MSGPARAIDVPPGDGTKAGFLRAFAGAVGMHDLYAGNWDAFADAFSSHVAGADEPLELRHPVTPDLPPGDLRIYREILDDLAAELPGRLTVSLSGNLTNGADDAAAPAVAVAHHHLNRGGVTRVAANHLLALAAAAPADRPPTAALLTGGRREAWGPHADELAAAGVRVADVTVPGLDYDDQTAAAPGAGTLADRLERGLHDAGADPTATVLHMHNHALGKTVALPGAVAELARRGWRCLLQLHDFAEEFRPANFARLRDALGPEATLYPQASHVHYAVLNGRDRGVLEDLGVPADRLHFLPNPVADFPPLPDKSDARRALAAACDVPADAKYLVYPVRGIRRKNLGEAILTGLLEPDAVVGVTLEPRNPVELRFHDRWRAFAAELDLPVRFGTGEKGGCSFHQNLAAADAVLTTSVAEGFGMVFLEAWLADRPLLGRDLPHVTADFKADGLALPGLYDSLTVPLAWVPEFPDRFRAGCEKLLADYRRPWDDAAFDAALAAKSAGDRVDFGDLDEPMQEAVIRRIADDPAARGEVRSVETDPGRPNDATVAANAAVVRTKYDLLGSGRRLRAVYDAVLASPVGPVGPPPNPRAALEAFLDLRTFRLIRG